MRSLPNNTDKAMAVSNELEGIWKETVSLISTSDCRNWEYRSQVRL